MSADEEVVETRRREALKSVVRAQAPAIALTARMRN